jgi:predicted nucleic acid-binding protein
MVDSSFFYKLMDRSEHKQEDCRLLLDQLIHAGARLLTTNFLVAETHSLILARTRRTDLGIRFLDLLQASAHLEIIAVTSLDEERAHQIVRQHTDKRFSLIDALAFAVMERLRVDTALSFDHNFRQYRFMTLPPDQ